MLLSETLRWGGLLLLLVSAAGPAHGQLSALTGELDQRIPEWLDYYQVPGVSVALIRDAHPVWSRGYGIADLTRGQAMTPATALGVAELAQPLTAWGVMNLAERGLIDLDAPVERYLRRWRFPESSFNLTGVTVRRLLSHRAGIPDLIYPPRFTPGGRPALPDLLTGKALGTAALHIDYEPGSRFLFALPNYSVLEMLIEDVTGEDYATYMRQTVLRPLQMRQSAFTWSLVPEQDRAAPHDSRRRPLPLRYADQRAAVGLVSTADDLARFVAAGLPSLQGAVLGYPVLRRSTVLEMQQPAGMLEGRFRERAESIGMGYLLEQTNTGYSVLSYQGFYLPGWQALFYAVPETGDGIVVLANGANGKALLGAIAGAWSAGCGIGALRLVRTLATIRHITWIATLVAAALAAALLAYFFTYLRQGGRRMADNAWTPRLLALLSMGLVASAAWLIVHPLLLNWMPPLAFWTPMAICAFCGSGSLLILFPRR